jgi:hypothetical protein
VLNQARRKATTLGQPDPLPELIANAVAEIRTAIGFKSQSLLDANTAALPPNLVDLAVQKICRALKKRIQMAFTPSEIDDEKTYNSRIGALTRGEWPVDAPLNPVVPTAQPAAGMGMSVVTRSRPQAGRHNLRGL